MPKKPATTENNEPSYEEVQTEYALAEFYERFVDPGIEFTLFRITRNGTSEWLERGNSETFNEEQIRDDYGAGTYMLRPMLRNRYIKGSIRIHIGEKRGANAAAVGHGDRGELERLKVELETQRVMFSKAQLEAEADRKEREQRNHELLVETIRAGHTKANGGGSIKEVIEGAVLIQGLAGSNSTTANLKEWAQIGLQVFNEIRESGSVADWDGLPKWLATLMPTFEKVIPAIANKFLSPQVPPVAQHPALMPTQEGQGPAIKPPTQEEQTLAVTQPAIEHHPQAPPPVTGLSMVSAHVRETFLQMQPFIEARVDVQGIVDQLLTLEKGGDSTAGLIMMRIETSEDFESWLKWFQLTIGRDTLISDTSKEFLQKLFLAAKAVPSDQ